MRDGNPEKSYGFGNALEKSYTSLEDIKRFLDKLQVKDTCWVFTGCKNPAGYGRIKIKKKGMLYVHRLAYILFIGSIEEAEDVHHKCKTRLCCNPWHLQKVKHHEHQEQAEPLEEAESLEEEIPF